MNADIKSEFEKLVLTEMDYTHTSQDKDEAQSAMRNTMSMMKLLLDIDESERSQLKMDLDQIYRMQQLEVEAAKIEADKARRELEAVQREDDNKKLIIIDIAGKVANHVFGKMTMNGMRRAQQEGLILPKNEIDTYNRTFFHRW